MEETKNPTQKPKHKNYFKVNETVWIKSRKKNGMIVELDIPNLTAKVMLTDPENTIDGYVIITHEDFKFWELSKFHQKTTKPKAKATHKKRDEILFAKVKPEAKIPSKRYEDGCYDVYACFDEPYMVIAPGEVKLIPCGIASSFSPKYRINCKRERGSTGTIGMAVMCGQIDSGYRGEWFVPIYNASDKKICIDKSTEFVNKTKFHDFILYPYTKAICQAALEFVPDVDIKEISYEELKSIPSERGTGMLGSSGK